MQNTAAPGASVFKKLNFVVNKVKNKNPITANTPPAIRVGISLSSYKGFNTSCAEDSFFLFIAANPAAAPAVKAI